MTIVSDGAEIYWEEHGHGFPLIMLHGNGQSSSMFAGQSAFFSESRRVIAIDSRGHGKSSSGGKKLSLFDMAEDLIAVMDTAGIEKADILGFSDGGNISLIFAVKHPERVRSLILSGANSIPQGLKFGFFAAMRMKHALLTIGSLFSQKCREEKDLLDLMLNEPNLRSWDLESIVVPTLITAGENDLIRNGHTSYIAAMIKGSVKHIFPGDHFTPEKLPDEYNNVVQEFLNSVDSKG